MGIRSFIGRSLRILAWVIVAGAIFAASWFYSLPRLSERSYTAHPGEFLIRLVLVPLAILLGVVTIAWMIRRLRKKQEAADSPSAKAPEEENPETGAEDTAPRPAILAYAILNSAGTDAMAIMERIRQGERAMELDDAFPGESGDLSLTGRMRDLEPEIAGDAAAGDATASGEGIPQTILARLHPMLSRLLDDLSAKLDLPALMAHEPDRPDDSRCTGAAAAATPTTIVSIRQSEKPNILPVHLFCGPKMPHAAKEALQQIFAGCWDATPWQTVKWSLKIIEDPGLGALVEADHAGEILGAGAPVALFIAVDSWFDPELLARLASEGKLHATHRQGGLIPAEGGAALLVADAAFCQARNISYKAILGHGRFGTRDTPPSHAGRANAETIEQCARQALEQAPYPPGEIRAVVCDSDYACGRQVETAIAMTECTPWLDPFADRLPINLLTGNLGAASGLSALALAGAFVESEARPALVLSVRHPVQRGAIVVMPPPAAADIAGTGDVLRQVA